MRAAAAGLGTAATVQSSTATAMLLSAFASRGLVALGPALAVMLGADVGTTLVVQALAFDLGAVVPVLLVGGVSLALGGRSDRMRQIGRIVVGFGLMILALGLIVEASDPLRESELVRLALGRLGGDPLLALVIAAALAWLFHSSVAFVLFVMSLAARARRQPRRWADPARPRAGEPAHRAPGALGQSRPSAASARLRPSRRSGR